MKSRCLMLCAVGLLAIPALRSSRAASELVAPKPVVSPIGFVKGYTWGWTGKWGNWRAPEAAESMQRLAETGTEWVTLAFLAHMPRHDIAMIAWGEANPRMVTDDEVRQAVVMAHANGFKVILKPVVDCLDGVWRAEIDFKNEDGSSDGRAWSIWWRSYEAFLRHYARLAEELGCEAFCVGCEMTSTELFADKWRLAIDKVRRIYTGPVLYNSAHLREDEVTWWDAVDIIGVGAYYTVGTQDDASIETMLTAYRPHVARLRQLALKWQKPIMFMEIGCRSAWGSQVWPGDFTPREWPVNLEVQSNFYEASLRAFWNEPWFCGYSWWDWPARLYSREAAATDTQFYIYAKPAEAVLRRWYARPRAIE